MSFDRTTLEALHRVAFDPTLEPFRKYLEQRRAAARDRLELALDVTQMTRAQGAAMEAKQIIEDIQAAKLRLEGAVRKPVTGQPGEIGRNTARTNTSSTSNGSP